MLLRVAEQIPSGYHIGVGGTVEESNKGEGSVAAVLPLMLILTLTVLMIQLQSFSRLFLVLSVVPLGLIGVVAALMISGKPMGFVALLGVLALCGMIARNSVILVDQIETLSREHCEIYLAEVFGGDFAHRPNSPEPSRSAIGGPHRWWHLAARGHLQSALPGAPSARGS